jgi:hypothetical protein
MRFFQISKSVFLLGSLLQGTQAGCCSLKYLTCDGGWCGSNKAQCESCSTPGMFWLKNGALPVNSCLERWQGCGSSRTGCCPGATCRPNGSNWMQCLDDTDDPPVNPGPTPAPVNPQTPAPVNPQTPAPVNPQTPAPVNPQTPAPVNPQTPAPVNPQTPAPVNPQTPAPVNPQTPAPVNPQTPAPANPQTPAPVNTGESFLLSTANAMNAWEVFQGLDSLTQKNSENPPFYALVAE